MPCVDPKVEPAQQITPPVRAFAQRGHHSRASVARHEQLAILSMNRTRPSVKIQVRLKYQDSLKNPVELGPGIHHRSAQPHQAADTSAPGQPAPSSHARANSVAWGPGWVPGPAAPRGRRHTGRCVLPRCAGGLRRLGGPARAGGRQASGPKTVGVHGHASDRRQHRAATEEPIITIIFSKSMLGFRARCGVHR